VYKVTNEYIIQPTAKKMLRLNNIKQVFNKVKHNQFLVSNVSAVTTTMVRPKTMLSMEDKLPHLPVPPLKQTMDKYIYALEPIMFESEYEVTKKVVDEFQKPGGVGEQLQNKLIEKAKGTDNWLSEWWDSCAYFGYRASVVINSSPGVAFPKQTFNTDADHYRYTAKLIHAVVNFKEIIDSESYPVDYAGKAPLTMVQYKKLLSVCRIPYARQDGDITAPPHQSRHVMVAHNNHFFALNVYKEGTNVRLSEEELVYALNKIVNESRYEDDYPIGVLTTQDRNIWGQGYKRLTRDSQNKSNIDKISKSICLICLDQPVEVPTNYKAAKYESAETSVALAQMLHGGGSHENSMNRWFDKICQFIVNRNGMVGICYEHSGAEGPPVMALCNDVMKIDFQSDPSYTLPKQGNNLAEKLTWNLNYDLVDRIELAKDFIDSSSSDLDLKLFKFDDFGKNVPKKYKMSPDAFFQVSLQLAYYRLHMHHPPTYESASIRKFSRGRTEAIRSATPESARYVREMDRNNYTDAEKRALLTKALQAHVQYTIDASNFEAIDRHMLGLKMIALENGMSLPEIFRDKAYGYAMHFRMSTSQVPSKYEACLCFGPVVPDGYGVCYNPMEKQILYAVSAYRSHPKTVAADLGEFIAKALQDINLLLSTQSKL